MSSTSTSNCSRRGRNRLSADCWAYRSASLTNHAMASLREVKNRVGHGGMWTLRKELARTRSTGLAPRNAIRLAAQGMENTDRASRATFLFSFQRFSYSAQPQVSRPYRALPRQAYRPACRAGYTVISTVPSSGLGPPVRVHRGRLWPSLRASIVSSVPDKFGLGAQVLPVSPGRVQQAERVGCL